MELKRKEIIKTQTYTFRYWVSGNSNGTAGREGGGQTKIIKYGQGHYLIS